MENQHQTAPAKGQLGRRLAVILMGSVLLGLMLFTITIQADELTRFDNGLASENLSFSGEQNHTRSISIIKLVNVTSATIELTGLRNDTGYVNQTNGFSLDSLGTHDVSIDMRGVAHDPTDNSFWVLDNDQHFLYHLNSSGGNLTDGFSLNVTIGSGPGNIVDVAYDHGGDSLYLVESSGDYVFHVDKSGTNQSDGFSLTGTHSSILSEAIAYDTSDDSFWVLDLNPGDVTLFHLNKSGANLTDGAVRLLPTTGMKHQGGGITYDVLDDTLWISEQDADFVYHVTTLGENLTDGFRVNSSLGTQVYGLTYDVNLNDSLWLVSASDDFVFHYEAGWPYGVWLEVGDPDGTREFLHTPRLNTTNTTASFASGLNTFLDDCTADGNGNCTVDFTFHSDRTGVVQYDSLDIQYNITNRVPRNYSIHRPLNASNLTVLPVINFTNPYDFDAPSDVLLAYIEVDDDPAFGSPDFVLKERQIALPVGAVAYWNFEEGSGATANDVWGGNDGAITGATYVPSLGRNGTGDFAFNFKELGEILSTDDILNNLTVISMWSKWDNLGATEYLMRGTDTDSKNLWYLASDATAVRYGWRFDDSGADKRENFAWSGILSNDTWYHLMVVADSIGGTHKFYVDGIERDSVASTYTIGAIENPTTFSKTASQSFNGTIDNVCTFNRIPTSVEINQTRDYGCGGITSLSFGSLVNVTDSDLVLALNFGRNETSNGYVFDESQYNSSGTVNGDPFWNASGGPDGEGVWEFDGVNDYINIPDNASINFTNIISFSYSLWFKTADIGVVSGNFDSLLNKRQSDSPFVGYLSTFSNDGSVNFRIDSDAVDVSVNSGGDFADKNWHQLVAVYDSVLDIINISVDGIHRDGASIVANDFSNNNPLHMGVNRGTANDFNGSIASPRIWNRSLTSTEISNLYKHGQPNIADGDWNIRGNVTEGTSWSGYTSTQEFTLDTKPNDLFVDSPLNQTYSFTTDTGSVDLNVSSTGQVNQWQYSTDGGETNNSFSPNTTLTGLSFGTIELLVSNDDSAGNTNQTSVTFAVLSIPTANSTNFTIVNLLNGNESLDVSFNVSDGEGQGNLQSCWVYTNFGNFSATKNTGWCNATISLPQNETVWMQGWVNDTHGLTGNGSQINGVQVDLLSLVSNTDAISNFTEQHFIEEFNITTQNPGTDINFSRNTTDIGRLHTLSAGQNLVLHNNVTADYVDEATSLTISGDIFTAGSSYSLTRALTWNNTQTNVSLRELKLTVNVSQVPFSSGMDVEKQIILYSDINYTHNRSSELLTFNLTQLNASQKDNYRYTYNGVFISLLNDDQADFRLAGDQKEWTYTPSFQVNLDLSGKEVNHTAATAQKLPEWNAKLNWASILLNSSSSSLSHTADDESDELKISFNPNARDTYDLTVTYYTQAAGGGGGSGGGGGGGGAAPVIIIQPAGNATVQNGTQLPQTQVITFDTTSINWLVPYTPSANEKVIRVRMEQGNLRGQFSISENLAPFVEVATCEPDTLRCTKNEIALDQGDVRDIILTGNWDGNASSVFQDQEQLAGFVKFGGVNRVHEIKITAERAPLFRASKLVSDSFQDGEGIVQEIPLDHQVAFFGLFGAIILTIIVVLLVSPTLFGLGLSLIFMIIIYTLIRALGL